LPPISPISFQILPAISKDTKTINPKSKRYENHSDLKDTKTFQIHKIMIKIRKRFGPKIQRYENLWILELTMTMTMASRRPPSHAYLPHPPQLRFAMAATLASLLNTPLVPLLYTPLRASIISASSSHTSYVTVVNINIVVGCGCCCCGGTINIPSYIYLPSVYPDKRHTPAHRVAGDVGSADVLT
jgi:hypothetical protein